MSSPIFHSIVDTTIEEYLAHQRALGRGYALEERVLDSLVSFSPKLMPLISTNPILKAGAIFISNSLPMSAARVSASSATSVSIAVVPNRIALSPIWALLPGPNPTAPRSSSSLNRSDECLRLHLA